MKMVARICIVVPQMMVVFQYINFTFGVYEAGSCNLKMPEKTADALSRFSARKKIQVNENRKKVSIDAKMPGKPISIFLFPVTLQKRRYPHTKIPLERPKSIKV